MTLSRALNNLEMAKQLLVVSAAGAVLWFVYRGSKAVVDTATEAAEDLAVLWVDINNPLVEAQIRLQPRYFNNGVLTNAAFDVISQGYPNLYRAAFTLDRRLRPEYTSLLNGDPVTDSMFI